MNKEQIKIILVDVVDVPKKTTFIHNGVLHVNSLMMPPVNSKPLEATSIKIHCQPEQTNLEDQVLTIDYQPTSTSASKSAK